MTHIYIPIEHRLRLWYSSKARALTLVTYRRYAENASTHSDGPSYVDFWSGLLFKTLKEERGLFKNDTDLAFITSTDGMKVFKTRKPFYTWPIKINCINLPPWVRFLQKNQLVVGFIPGPNNPIDIDSFLFPMVQEFLKLGSGVRAWDASSGKDINLHAHLCLVGSDMIGRQKLMATMGNRACSYCEYCNIRGVYKSGICCPHKPPADAPPEVIAREASKPGKDEAAYEFIDYDEAPASLRTDKSFRDIAAHIVKWEDKKYAKIQGIKGEAILGKLPSIIFPWSFPPDIMHLSFENVVPKLMRHYRGVFFGTGSNVAGADYEQGMYQCLTIFHLIS